jgi:indole-3-glycerol phosphate synthase
MNILQQILNDKKTYIDHRKTIVPTALLKESIHFDAPTISLKEYLLRDDKSGIIAEFKRKSPSRGNINPYAEVDEISIGYMQAGASALSVLTDAKYFGGNDQDLQLARKLNYCPILRKDFIVDPYQILEARSIGADAILLIASVLDCEQIKDFTAFATEIGLEVLLEVHHDNEFTKIPNSDVIMGVNARNLETFEVSLQNCVRMFPNLPTESIKVAESGIHQPEDIVLLKEIGFNGFLIGERFMATANPGQACRDFIQAIPTLNLAVNA